MIARVSGPTAKRRATCTSRHWRRWARADSRSKERIQIQKNPISQKVTKAKWNSWTKGISSWSRVRTTWTCTTIPSSLRSIRVTSRSRSTVSKDWRRSSSNRRRPDRTKAHNAPTVNILGNYYSKQASPAVASEANRKTHGRATERAWKLSSKSNRNWAQTNNEYDNSHVWFSFTQYL